MGFSLNFQCVPGSVAIYSSCQSASLSAGYSQLSPAGVARTVVLIQKDLLQKDVKTGRREKGDCFCTRNLLRCESQLSESTCYLMFLEVCSLEQKGEDRFLIGWRIGHDLKEIIS